MRNIALPGLVGLVLSLTGTAAAACSPAPSVDGTVRGEMCAVSHTDANGQVFSGSATKMSPNVVRQFITSGNVCSGEQIVIYYDCSKEQAVWLGGDYQFMGAFSPDGKFYTENEKGEILYVQSSGPAEWFVVNLEDSFAPDYAIEKIQQSVGELGWMPQKGRLDGATIAVDGKRFNLACGCNLPQTGDN